MKSAHIATQAILTLLVLFLLGCTNLAAPNQTQPTATTPRVEPASTPTRDTGTSSSTGLQMPGLPGWLFGEEVIATVNGMPISVSAYQKRLKYDAGSITSQLSYIDNSLAQLGNDPSTSFLQLDFMQKRQELISQLISLPQNDLENLIDDELVRDETEKRNITVSADEIDQEIEKDFGYERSTPAPNGKEAPSPSAVGSGTPEPTDTPMTYEGYQTQKKRFLDAISKSAGISEADFRKMIEALLLRRKLQVEIAKTVPATAEQVEARHILVADYDHALEVANKLKRDGDFAKLASQYSTDTSNKDQGGYLGWFPRGVMVKEFEDVAFSLQVNEISKPVTTTYGVHLVQVLGHEQNRALDQSALGQAQSTAFNDWLESALRQAKVERHFKTSHVPEDVASIIRQVQSGK